MPTDNKVIKFVVTIDEQGTRRATQLVQQLSRMSADALRDVARVQAAVFGGATGAIGGQPFTGSRGVAGPLSARAIPATGGGDINQRMSRTLQDQKNAFKLLAQENKNALKIVGDQLRQNLAVQEQELASMTETIEGLVSRYERLKKSADTFRKQGAHGLAQAHELAAQETSIDIMNTAGAKQAKRDEIQALKSNSSMSPGDAMLIAGAVARAVGSAIGGIGQTIQSEKLLGLGNVAGINQAVQGRMLGRMMQGDVRDFYFMKQLNSRLTDDFSGTKAAAAGYLGDVVGGVGGFAAGVGTMMAGGGAGAAGKGAGIVRTAGDVAGAGSGAVSGLLGAHMAYEQLTSGGPEAAEARTMAQGVGLTEEANPVTNAAFDVLAQERGIRASSSRRLMGMHMAARGLGAGYGYDFGSAVGAAESLQRMTGMQGMFGSSSSRTTGGNPAHQITSAEALQFQKLMLDPNIPQSTKAMMAQGMAQAGTVSPTVTTTTHSRGLLESSFQLAGHGIDLGVGQQALASTFGALGGGKGAAENSMKAMERAVERGVAKGFTDPRTQEELIGTIGKAASGTILSGTQGLERVSAFLTAGGSGNMTVTQAQARAGVLQGLDNLGASNPFFQGVNVASSKRFLGAGASPLALMGLSGASTTELLTGGQRFDDLGITQGQRMGAFKDRIGSVIGAYANLDPEVAQAVKAAGGDYSKIDKKLIRRVLRETKTFGTDQAASAAADMFSDLGSVTDLTGVKGSKLKQYTDGLAAASISMEERTKAELIGKEVAKAMGEMYKNIDPVKLVQQMREEEEKGKNYDFSSGRMLIVQVVRQLNQMPPQSANARGKQ